MIGILYEARNEDDEYMDEGRKLDQNRMPLVDAILSYNEKKPAYFCIPGHRYERGINPALRELMGDRVFQFDLTETPYTDDLHHAEGAIKEAEALAADLFGATDTHFLINGTTCGNQAMVLTAASYSKKIAIPRNAHKSVLMGLIFSGAQPVYLMPEIFSDTGLHGGICPEEVERALFENPDCKSVLVVSPTYYGLCSDLEKIAAVCHKYDAALLVDEAHGAHCYFSELLPKGALTQGADVCAQSIHKVAGALTQSSMLHVNSALIARERLESNLHLVQSTSPSYLLMTSLDAARQDLALHGEEMAANAVCLAEDARCEIRNISGISCIGDEVVGHCSITGFDPTRLTFSGAQLGLTGFELKRILFEKYNCDTELADYQNVLAIVTFANERQELQRLIEALREISQDSHRETLPFVARKYPEIPPYVLSPRDAYFAEKERVPWEEAMGEIAGEMIAPYPPGIPVLCPGERISRDIWEYLEEYKHQNGHFHGPTDHSLQFVRVIKGQRQYD